jgi:hypothetical protein
MSITRVWGERVGEAVVEATGMTIRETEREYFERGNPLRYEPTPQTLVKDRTPICRRWAWRCRGRHEMESLAEVGRVLMKMH